MKKQYATIDMTQKEFASNVNSEGTHSNSVLPVIKVDNVNAKIMGDVFELPEVSSYDSETLQIGIRQFGILLTDKLYKYMSGNIPPDSIGKLIPYFQFGMHRRFGEFRRNYICPLSVNMGRCPICDGRLALFKHPKYKTGEITKHDIFDSGHFNTRSYALVIGAFYLDGEYLGVHPWITTVSNEYSKTNKRDSFFDFVDVLTTPKRINTGETLPRDYYGYGPSARWLIAEYSKATFTSGEGRNYKYWKLNSITPARSLEDQNGQELKAEDIWWKTDENGNDMIESVDIMDLFNFASSEEITECTKNAMKIIIDPPNPLDNDLTDTTSHSVSEKPKETGINNWADLVTLSADELVEIGLRNGESEDNLIAAKETSLTALRSAVAGLLGIRPVLMGRR